MSVADLLDQPCSFYHGVTLRQLLDREGYIIVKKEDIVEATVLLILPKGGGIGEES